jgi:predicted ATPase
MSHPFGDLLTQHLHRKHGLSQSKLAAGVLQDPSIIGKMSKGQRLSGRQARERVLAVIQWLCEQHVLTTTGEANQLLAAAGMAALRASDPTEHTLLQRLMPQTDRPTSARETRRRTNLPAPLTSFVGRAQEVTDVAQLVSANRLVTLTGAGGVGKTRLALETAKAILDFRVEILDAEPTSIGGNPKFPDGVWFVELAALAAGDLAVKLIAQAMARVFKQPEQASQSPLDAIEDYLTDQQLLLVLDNCEHLVDACAEICERLLQRCWRLHILATSREELHIPGEVVYAVSPLALPNPTANAPEQMLACASAQLFVERMHATPALPKVQSAEIATLAHICRQLDGIPLALELAAPLTRSLSLAEIATQLDNQMALLTNGYRTAIPRHQTMHSALVWSYRLLAREEQQLLARVAVFSGGWTQAAARAVWADDGASGTASSIVAALLNQLIAKSLVWVETQNGERRYRLLEPVRQFAHAQLAASGEQEMIRQRHATYFLSLAEKMDQARDTPQEQAWLQTLEPERDNLRAVNRWAFDHHQAEFAQRFNGFLFAFWGYRSSMGEARQWLEGSLALKPAETQAERTPRALLAEASALNLAGHTAALMHDFSAAQSRFKRELQVRVELDDRRGIANALRGIAFVLMLSNENLPQAQDYVEQALAIDRAAQDAWGCAWSLHDLGYLALARGELTRAQTLLEEVLPTLREQGNNFGCFSTLLALGHLRRAVGDPVQARRCYWDALHLQQKMHYLLHIADGLEGLAAIAVAEQQPTTAVQLLGAAYAHRRANALTRPYYQDAGYEHAVTSLRSQLTDEAWNRAWSAGCAMTLEQAVEFALKAC